MVIHRAYDEVLRSWSHVAVLRALLDTTVGFTGNEVARLSGMQPRSALKALSSLEQLGIVRRQRGGRDHLFTLNRDHYLVAEGLLPLYEAESRFPPSIEKAIVAVLEDHVVSALIFGSVVRRQETPQSDLDICCVVRSESEKGAVQERLSSEASSLSKEFGVKLAPVYLTLQELRAKARSSLVRQILKEGKSIVGKTVQELARV